MIGGGEYRYISPVFSFNAETGHVERLMALGLTNTPGLSGLTDLAGLAAQLPDTSPRESDRSIEAFNRAFGEVGIFHPQTPPKTLAELAGTMPKPALPLDMSDSDEATMRFYYPDTFA
jgi:phage I-like protein